MGMYQKREPGGQHSSTIIVGTRDEYDDIYDKGDKESITSDSDSSWILQYLDFTGPTM